MKRLLLLPILLLCKISFGQVTINGAGTYSQDFNTLANTGTGIPWTDNTTIPNIYSQRTGTGTTYNVDAGTSTGGNLYSYGAASATERALGTIGSANATAGNFAHGLAFHNTGTNNVGTFTVTYTLEQWRVAAKTTTDTLFVYYKKSSSPITALNPNSNGTWTRVQALTTYSPIVAATASALDGNLPANRMTRTNIVIPGLIVSAGEYLMIKWDDPDHSGSDNGLAVDDLSVSWSVSCVTTNTINVSACQTYTVPSGDETYTTSGTYLDTIPNAALCDSIITINLTIKNNSTNTISPVACGSFTVPSGDETYTVAGTYMDTIPNTVGCDSILTINLTFTGSITYYADTDNDGFGNPAVSQTGCSPIAGYVTNNSDCDDSNNAIGIGATWYQDVDNDGLGNAAVSQVACSQPGGYVSNNTDCDDNNNAIGAGQLYYVDADNDGYGSAVATGVSSCTPLVGSVTNNTDCNDNNNAIHPGANEIPDNGIDEDCSGADLNTIGNELALYEFFNNNCGTPVWSVTAQPANATFSDYDTTGALTCQAALGVFNYAGFNTTATVDLTQYYSFTMTPSACYGAELNRIIFTHKTSASGGTPTVHLRSSLDNFASDIAAKTLPNSNAKIDTIMLNAGFDNITAPIEFRWYITDIGGTGATYRHDNVKVYGFLTALPQQTYYADTDGDGYGNPAVTVSNCVQPNGYVSDNTDCNDSDSTEFPGAVWYQDSDNDGFGNASVSLTQCLKPNGYVSNNTDCNDNDNQVGAAQTYYVDADNDGHGSASATGVVSCTPIAGSVTNNDDCNDAVAAMHPGAVEICDGFDNDCDGNTDEGFTQATYYQDLDNDTYGNPNVSVTDCVQPTGYVTNNTDCNDNNSAIHPGAADQTGNGIDENCDGVDGVLGIEESILGNLNVFPNPGTSTVVLSMNNGWNGFQVSFTSADGKVITLSSVQKSINELEFNTEALVPGIYLIQLTSASGTASVRWVKK